MPKYVAQLMSGGVLDREAHHYQINDENGQIVFYKTETEVDDEIVLFKHGVISIKTEKPLPSSLGMFDARK